MKASVGQQISNLPVAVASGLASGSAMKAAKGSGMTAPSFTGYL